MAGDGGGNTGAGTRRTGGGNGYPGTRTTGRGDADPGTRTTGGGDPSTRTTGRASRLRSWYARHGARRGLASDTLSWLRNDVLLLAVAALDLTDYLASAEHEGRRMLPGGAALVVLTVLLLLPRRGSPLRTFTALAVAQTAAGLFVPTYHGLGAAMMLALYGVARTVDRATLVWACALALSTNALRALASDSPAELVLSDVVAIAFVVLVAGWVRRWRRQTELTRRLLAERAVADERRRIARELHDVVAHHITTVYLLSGGARTMLDHDVAASREALLTLESSARSALGEMRELLGVLRSDEGPDEPGGAAPSEPQPGAADIAGLVAGSAAAGLPARLSVTGGPPPAPVPATTGLTLYRIVQEALTNARKHAGDGARAEVRLAYRPGEVAVEITDDGRGPRPRRTASPLAGGGYGLLGMRERVAVHGGTFEAGARRAGGFRVAATVPLPPS
ncbi:sensor histidine kinase [Streptomyces sp. NPDC058953]|uniref:sensor histidine kinase n=1 Tax=unclassified Streptomyces TaxID=2593676 RepID=UPI0036BB22F2